MDTSKRLLSLDVLRGITISFMILVNTPGSWTYVYSPLRHAKWHGCTPTDLVFPFFLFIVGISVWFSFKKYETQLSTVTFFKIIKRTAIIFLIGLFLNLYPFFNFSEVRIMGVLQRIALAYGVGAIMCLSLNRRGLLIALFAILLGYWGVMGFGAEDLVSLENNRVRSLDLWLLGEQHIYKGFGIPFDPEGILSAIPSVGTVIIGFFIGQILSVNSAVVSKIRKLIVVGTIMVILGLIWGVWFPINKPIWTSSYVLYTAGIGCGFLAVLIFIIDYKGFRKWTVPFVHFGMNPLFIFVISGLYVKTMSYLIHVNDKVVGEKVSGYKYLFEHIFSPLAGPMNGSLLFALVHILVFWFVCYFLYKRKIFIKI
ncbi:DUF5009 domain-containing protein [Aestuariibaculum sp. TT11]|uniref:DUF5009 domain-containing protein n=1 Tax=Aestuariibaculum sediminum TaxID=2770637 RepID=A0A8J6U8J3_9FLAO|nr:DUF5009 domain-containing protein [Aestuariibaculum sediminum]